MVGMLGRKESRTGLEVANALTTPFSLCGRAFWVLSKYKSMRLVDAPHGDQRGVVLEQVRAFQRSQLPVAGIVEGFGHNQ